MDGNSYIFIAGSVLLFILWILFPLVFNNKRARINRYFRKQKDVRFPLVLDISKNPSSVPEDLSPREMVAILTLISVRYTVSDGIKAALRFSSMSWGDKYNGEFFDRVEVTARDFSSKRWEYIALSLYNLGKSLAQSQNDSHWEKSFSNSAEGLRYRLVQKDLKKRPDKS